MFEAAKKKLETTSAQLKATKKQLETSSAKGKQMKRDIEILSAHLEEMADKQNILEENLSESKHIIDDYREEHERYIAIDNELRVKDNQIQGT